MRVETTTVHGVEAVAWSQGAGVVRRIVPPLSFAKHKGEGGRVAVLGGSLEYTGAPYYAAAATLQVGADLAWVLCADAAATPIKSYSPELIVIPCYRSAERSEQAVADELCARVAEWLPRLHGLVIGPGLGRRQGVLEGAGRVLEAACDRGLPVIVDADGLFLVSKRPDLVRGRTNVTLTPNAAEFAHLRAAVLGGVARAEGDDGVPEAVRAAKELIQVCQALEGVTIVRKGRMDLISDGRHLLAVDEPTSARRCGGLGDVLAGSVATLSVWASRARSSDLGDESRGASPSLWAAYGACVLARRAARAAFESKRRSMTAPDALARVGACFEDMCPTIVADDGA